MNSTAELRIRKASCVENGTKTPSDAEGNASEPISVFKNPEDNALLMRFLRRRRRKPPKFKQVQSDSSAEREGSRLLFEARLMEAFGTADHDLVSRLLTDVTCSVPARSSSTPSRCNYALAVLHGINPRDELEGLIAVQMLAVHNLAMEFLRRAALKGQTSEGLNTNVNRASKLLRTFVAQVECLHRYRGKGQQKVTVEHVHVHQGGQAIVGAVNHTRLEGGGNAEQDRGSTPSTTAWMAQER